MKRKSRPITNKRSNDRRSSVARFFRFCLEFPKVFLFGFLKKYLHKILILNQICIHKRLCFSILFQWFFTVKLNKLPGGSGR